MSVRKWMIILLLAGLAVSTASVAVSAQQQVGTVKIASPAKNSTVSSTETVSGQAQLSSGYTLWIVPYDGISGRYYPQGGPVTIDDNASWSTRLSLGNFNVGQKFQIQAIATAKSASSAFSSYVSSGQKGGMKSLPAGAQAVDSITVTRGTSSSTGNATASSASPSMIPIVTQNVSTTTSASTSNVVQASASASSSQSPLPGFEAVYALGALAIAFVLVFKGRLLK
ncbi:MAG: hypothetical protein ACXV49_07855 [Halobacteriota archaeon]